MAIMTLVSGILLMTGRMEDNTGGILILDVDTLEKANEISYNDPYVKAGKFEALSLK